MKNNSLTPILILFLTFIVSCENLIEVDPPKSELITETVFKSDPTANATMTAIYSQLRNNLASAGSNVSILGAFSADELIYLLSVQEMQEINTNSIISTNSTISILWSSTYNLIYQANAVIEGLENSENITPALKSQLEGEALFIRAFCHFYLLNFYGDIPYITTTDYRANTKAERLKVSEIYEYLIDDLLLAKEMLPNDYSHGNGERIRANKSVVSALLARIYLYTENWQDAENESTLVINNPIYNLTDLGLVFLKNSEESIFQLHSTIGNTYEGQVFIPNPNATGLSFAAFTQDFIDSFEANDLRKDSWIGIFDDGINFSYYPHKYKQSDAFTSSPTEYTSVLRLSEMYLIRSEARANSGNTLGAQNDLNIIRNRAGLPDTVSSSQIELLSAVNHERRVELFTEWGHRWFDLKRTGKADEILSLVKPAWNSNAALYPIPESEILINSNLTQNPGY